MKKFVVFLIFIVIVVFILLFNSFDSSESYLKKITDNTNKSTNLTNTTMASKTYTDNTVVILHTNQGDITLNIFTKDLPITGGNFVELVSKGFYDNVVFHRVIANFMIQGGDPQGTGMGGPGYTIKDEFLKVNKNNKGTISMANAGPNTGGSQFFINLVDNNYLDTKHPVFGEVTAGMDVVEKIGQVQVDYNDRPLQEVKIDKAEIKK